MTELIDKAINAIGKEAAGDFILDTKKHSEQLKAEAPELARLLSSSAIQAIMEDYNTYDQRALKFQNEFFNWSGRARKAIFITVCTSALLVATPGIFSFVDGTVDIVTFERFFIGILMVISIVFGAIAAMSFNVLKTKKLLPRWMESRAYSEENRVEYFGLLSTTFPEGNLHSEEEQTLHKLEYFRRYQLNMQYAYYKSRANSHGAKADKSLTILAILMGGIILVNGIAGAFGTLLDPNWTIIAALALVLQGVVSLLSSKESIEQNEHNAERYERTRITLNKLRGKLSEVRLGIADGELRLLETFTKAVNDVLSLEHRQWITDLESKQSAVNQLEMQLKKRGEG